MRFVVYGVGAIGGVLAGQLVGAGYDVVAIARGEHGEVLRERGLRLQTPDADVRVELPVVEQPGEITFGADDVVLLAVKSHQTPVALSALQTAAAPSTPIVCVQNGVENERAALRRFARVYGVAMMCPAAHLAPGVVRAYSTPVPGLLDVGAVPSGIDDVAHEIQAAFAAARFDSIARDDIMRWKRAKLLTNLGNAIEAACGPPAREGPIGPIVRAEGVACLEAAGLDYASEAEDAQRRGDLIRRQPVAGEARPGGSTWQSLQRGTGAVETDFLNGEIVLLGRLHGVPTPANALLQHHANRLAAGGLPPGSVPEGRFLAELEDR